MLISLPSDEEEMETVIAKSIADTIKTMDIPNEWKPKVYDLNQFANSDEEDELISTIADPVSLGLKRTHIIEVGIPTVYESPYTSDGCTQLVFEYPISYECEVVAKWANPMSGVRFLNSAQLVKAVYMRSRRKMKQNIQLGFENVVHEYLQQVSAVIVTDEETGGMLHSHDWSLTVKATSIIV